MSHVLLETAARLSDAQLLRRVDLLAGREREATVELVGHLAELDARKLYPGEGYGSLFSYCTGALRLGEHAAYMRIVAARLCREFPAVLDRLAEGALNLSTVRLLAPHLRPDNFETVVAQARGRSKREVEALVARLAPRPDVPPLVRRLPVSAAAPLVPESAAGATVKEAETEIEAFVALATSRAPDPPAPRPVVAPLAPERYRVQFTVGAATHEKLRQVQDLLRRELPDGDPGQIFDRALTLLLEDLARRRLAQTSRPRKGTATRPGSRHIPASVKRAVWLRDGGRCAFVARNGRLCGERTFLEFHHCEPYGIGGDPTVVNISLRCRAHNVYESELVFGTREGQLAPGRVAVGGSGSVPNGGEAPVPCGGP